MRGNLEFVYAVCVLALAVFHAPFAVHTGVIAQKWMHTLHEIKTAQLTLRGAMQCVQSIMSSFRALPLWTDRVAALSSAVVRPLHGCSRVISSRLAALPEESVRGCPQESVCWQPRSRKNDIGAIPFCITRVPPNVKLQPRRCGLTGIHKAGTSQNLDPHVFARKADVLVPMHTLCMRLGRMQDISGHTQLWSNALRPRQKLPPTLENQCAGTGVSKALQRFMIPPH